jgi:hypothetical protein
VTNCSRCSRALNRNLCFCCDLPRSGSFSKNPICEHRPEFAEFVAWAKETEIYATYQTWWNSYRKPKPRIEIASSSYSPFDARLPASAEEAVAEEVPVEKIEPITPILPILATIPELDPVVIEAAAVIPIQPIVEVAPTPLALVS